MHGSITEYDGSILQKLSPVQSKMGQVHFVV